jgi:DNA-binding response OmpR family regulator
VHSIVLVVEDEELIALHLRETLLDAGFGVELRCEGNDDAVLAGEHACAAIIDVGLPGIMGNDLAALLRARQPNLPILLVTGYDENLYRKQFASDERLRVVSKPFDSSMLLQELEALAVTPRMPG